MTKRDSVAENSEVWRACKFSCLRGKGTHSIPLAWSGRDVKVGSLPMFFTVNFRADDGCRRRERAVKMREKVWKKIQNLSQLPG